MEHEKARIRFFIDRWGNSPAIFGYDLFNEIHPHWGGSPEDQHRWVTEMAQFVKSYEMEKWGKRHLLTVSVFGAFPEGGYIDLILRHPELDFATTHVYQNDAKDNPKDTVSGAITMRDAVRFAYANMADVRPYTDTESGPIFGYMHTRQRPSAEFENEYYHNMTWAHLATGGAGSGMRWPFRDPHTLSPGMHDVMLGMSRFIKADSLRWLDFCPQPLDDTLRVVPRDKGEEDADLDILPFGCSYGRQALVWLLRDTRTAGSQAADVPLDLMLPSMADGEYAVEFWETYDGNRVEEISATVVDSTMRLPLPDFGRDLAIAVRPREAL
jgi:mannan endo-1,4-beta-mannosidase